MNKSQTGIVSELLAQAYFIEEGYTVSKPINDFHEYDLIIDKGKLDRVQIKTIYFDNSKQRYLVSCVTSHIRGNHRRTNKKYTIDSFDFLCCVSKEKDAVYLIPIEHIAGRRSLTIYFEENNKNIFERFRVK